MNSSHYTDHVSSYPFKSKLQLGDGGSDANPKGNIIVGGNPAKVIRFRFSERIISKLMSLDFSLVSKEVADKCLKELYLDITEENVDEVVNTIKEYQGYVTPDSNISP